MTQDVSVKLKFVRHSARKIRPVARIFVGKNLVKSIDTASLMSQDSARFLFKAMNMAKSAAEAKEFDANQMIVKSVNVSEGPKIKRMRPNARGRSNAYYKHLAHILLTVAPEVEKKQPKAKKEVKAEETK